MANTVWFFQCREGNSPFQPELPTTLNQRIESSLNYNFEEGCRLPETGASQTARFTRFRLLNRENTSLLQKGVRDLKGKSIPGSAIFQPYPLIFHSRNVRNITSTNDVRWPFEVSVASFREHGLVPDNFESEQLAPLMDFDGNLLVEEEVANSILSNPASRIVMAPRIVAVHFQIKHVRQDPARWINHFTFMNLYDDNAWVTYERLFERMTRTFLHAERNEEDGKSRLSQASRLWTTLNSIGIISSHGSGADPDNVYAYMVVTHPETKMRAGYVRQVFARQGDMVGRIFQADNESFWRAGENRIFDLLLKSPNNALPTIEFFLGVNTDSEEMQKDHRSESSSTPTTSHEKGFPWWGIVLIVIGGLIIFSFIMLKTLQHLTTMPPAAAQAPPPAAAAAAPSTTMPPAAAPAPAPPTTPAQPPPSTFASSFPAPVAQNPIVMQPTPYHPSVEIPFVASPKSW